MDIEDLNNLLKQANRQKSKDLIGIEIRKLNTELSTINENSGTNEIKVIPTPQKSGPKVYEVKLNNYAWDQSEKFVKLYVTLKNVQTLPNESVTCNFTNRSMDLHVFGLDNRNYHLPIINLCEKIDPEKSSYKVKNDMVVIFLAKKSPKNWSCVTGVEKKIKDAKENLFNPDPEAMSDPESSLMGMMKKMYQDGDDDMKKTIAKAWCDSQDKKAAGAGLDFPNI